MPKEKPLSMTLKKQSIMQKQKKDGGLLLYEWSAYLSVLFLFLRKVSF